MQTSKNTKNSPLLWLPPELRDRIFYLSLLHSTPSAKTTLKASAATYLSLQLTCHTINEETHVLPFQAFPISLPRTFGTNSAATLQVLRRMKEWQIKSVRKVEVGVLGSVYEVEEAGKVVRMLWNGREGAREERIVEQCGVSPDVARMFMWRDVSAEDRRIYEGEDKKPTNGGLEENVLYGREHEDASATGSRLRELTITITARDVMTPMADSRAGMEKMLDLETSPFFIELLRGLAEGLFRELRKVVVNVELGPSLKEAFSKEKVQEWKEGLWERLNLARESEGRSEGDCAGEEGGSTKKEAAKGKVKVEVAFNRSALTSASEYFAALGGDELWCGDSTNTSMGVMASAMLSLSAGAGRPF